MFLLLLLIKTVSLQPLISVLLVLGVCGVTVSESESVFTEEPSPGPLRAPLGTQVLLTCSVTESYRIVWRYLPPGVTDSELAVDVDQTLKTRGIIVENPSNTTSHLIVNGTEGNSHSSFTCLAIKRDDQVRRSRSRRVEVVFYGPPSAPINLTTTERGIGSVRISWDHETRYEVTVNFTLNVTNLNNSKIVSTIVPRIQQQYYISTVEDPSPCDVYSFQVTAVNDAGASEPSEIITRNLPSLPDLSPVEDSLHHSLVKSAEGMMLSVMFNEVTILCPEIELPVMNYTLILEDSEGSRVESSSVTVNNKTVTIEILLMENSLYSYYIRATNEYGSNTSTAVDITTTDVEIVTVCRREETIYSIQCSYINGSNAKGCIYVFVNMVVGNITGIIERTNSEGDLVNISNIGYHKEVLAYDWECNNTTGNLTIRGNINSNETCPITKPPDDPSPTSSVNYLLFIVLAIILLVVVLVCIMVGVVVCFYKKGYCVKWREHYVVSAEKVTPVTKVELNKNENNNRDTDQLHTAQLQEGKNGNGSVEEDGGNVLYSILSANQRAGDSSLEEAPENYSQLNSGPVYQVLESIPLPPNKISGSTEDPTATQQDTSTVMYSVPDKSAPASLEDPPPIYHVPDKPNPIQEDSTLHSNEISTDAEAPPIPPFCVCEESTTEVSSLGTLL